MTKEQKIMRRALQWAAQYRRVGDTDGEQFAMQRYRKAAERVNRAMEYAFAAHINLDTGVVS